MQVGDRKVVLAVKHITEPEICQSLKDTAEYLHFQVQSRPHASAAQSVSAIHREASSQHDTCLAAGHTTMLHARMHDAYAEILHGIVASTVSMQRVRGRLVGMLLPRCALQPVC